MTEVDPLAQAIHHKLERIRVSNGYFDTAQQIAEYLREKGFDTATWERVHELEAENRSLQFRIDTLIVQYKARDARQAAGFSHSTNQR